MGHRSRPVPKPVRSDETDHDHDEDADHDAEHEEPVCTQCDGSGYVYRGTIVVGRSVELGTPREDDDARFGDQDASPGRYARRINMAAGV